MSAILFILAGVATASDLMVSHKQSPGQLFAEYTYAKRPLESCVASLTLLCVGMTGATSSWVPVHLLRHHNPTVPSCSSPVVRSIISSSVTVQTDGSISRRPSNSASLKQKRNFLTSGQRFCESTHQLSLGARLHRWIALRRNSRFVLFHNCKPRVLFLSSRLVSSIF